VTRRRSDGAAEWRGGRVTRRQSDAAAKRRGGGAAWLDLCNVHLCSSDTGKTWKNNSEDPFKSPMSSVTGECAVALPVFGHIGADDTFGQVDPVIVMGRYNSVENR
jgi:hypothetical protein